jgi:uncharacterized protein (TIGR02452 family)
MAAAKTSSHPKRMSRRRHAPRSVSRSRSLTLLPVKQPASPAPTPKSPKPRPRRRGARLTPARAERAALARDTARVVLGSGKYVAAGVHTESLADPAAARSDAVVHDVGVQIMLSTQATEVFAHDSEPQARSVPSSSTTTFAFTTTSVVDALVDLCADPTTSTSRIGVVSPACPTRPGGYWLTGADDTETQLLRATSLAANLSSARAAPFYAAARRTPDASVLYAPNVLLLRAGADAPVLLPAPRRIDVLSVARGADGRVETKARLARALRVLAARGVRRLVLPALGCEDGQAADPADVADMYAELLVCGDADGPAPFAGVFESVTFCVRAGTVDKRFRRAWDVRTLTHELDMSFSEEEEEDCDMEPCL